jgi:hypothetical protein
MTVAAKSPVPAEGSSTIWLAVIAAALAARKPIGAGVENCWRDLRFATAR